MLGNEPLQPGESRVCILPGHRIRLFHRSIGEFRVAAGPYECPEGAAAGDRGGVALTSSDGGGGGDAWCGGSDSVTAGFG